MDKRLFWDFIISIICFFSLFLSFKIFLPQGLLRDFLIKVGLLLVLLFSLFGIYGLSAHDLHWVEQHYEGVGIVILFIGLFELFLLRRPQQRKSKVL